MNLSVVAGLPIASIGTSTAPIIWAPRKSSTHSGELLATTMILSPD